MGADMCFSYNKVFPALDIYGIILLSPPTPPSKICHRGLRLESQNLFLFLSLCESDCSREEVSWTKLTGNLTTTLFERKCKQCCCTALHCGLTKADQNFNTLQGQDFSQVSGNSTQQRVFFLNQ